MKRIKHIAFGLAVGTALLLSGCDVTDPIYDSVGEVTLTTDWTNTNLSEAPAAGYTVAVGDQSATITDNPASVENLFQPGTYTGYVYTAADKITVSGTDASTVATVAGAATPAGASGTFIAPDPAFLYSGSKDVTIEKNKEHDITVTMRQDVRELTFIIRPDGDATHHIESVTAMLGGIAGAWNLHTDEASGAAVNVAPVFEKVTSGANAGDWTATVRLLGITGTTQTLEGTITFTAASNLAPITFSKPLHEVAGFPAFNSDKKTPMALEAHVVDVHGQLSLGDFTAIPGWNGNGPGEDVDSNIAVAYVNSLAARVTIAYDAAASDASKTVYNFFFPAGFESAEITTAVVTSTTASTPPSNVIFVPPLSGNTLMIGAYDMAAVAGTDIKVVYTITYGGVTSTAATSLIVPFTGVANNVRGGVYYQEGIATGMVYIPAPTPSDGSGRAVSLQEENTGGYGIAWGPTGTTIGVNSDTDGRLNMKTVYEFNSNTFDNYPAFGWVHALNPAGTTYSTGATGIWYLPARNELGNSAAGSLYVIFNDNGKDAFNTLLTSAGGTILTTGSNDWPYYWSSTEGSGDNAWYVHFNGGNTYGANKNYPDRVRAVLAF